jgi:hypothetical protein
MPVRIGPMIRVADLIRQAEEQGCQLHLSTLRLVTPGGFLQIRYLFNPTTRGRFPLTDYEDQDFMLADEMDAAARRLNIVLG